MLFVSDATLAVVRADLQSLGRHCVQSNDDRLHRILTCAARPQLRLLCLPEPLQGCRIVVDTDGKSNNGGSREEKRDVPERGAPAQDQSDSGI